MRAIEDVSAWQDLENQLRLNVDGLTTLEDAFSTMDRVADRFDLNVADVGASLSQFYALARAGVIDVQQVGTVAEATGAILRRFGANAEQARRFMLGLTQGLSGDFVRSEEIFLQMNEAVRGFVANLAAASDISFGELAADIRDGGVETEKFLNLLLRLGEVSAGEYDKIEDSISRATTRFENEYNRWIRVLERPVSAAVIGTLERCNGRRAERA